MLGCLRRAQCGATWFEGAQNRIREELLLQIPTSSCHRMIQSNGSETTEQGGGYWSRASDILLLPPAVPPEKNVRQTLVLNCV